MTEWRFLDVQKPELHGIALVPLLVAQEEMTSLLPLLTIPPLPRATMMAARRQSKNVKGDGRDASSLVTLGGKRLR